VLDKLQGWPQGIDHREAPDTHAVDRRLTGGQQLSPRLIEGIAVVNIGRVDGNLIVELSHQILRQALYEPFGTADSRCIPLDDV
jgi:hypothetical protein